MSYIDVAHLSYVLPDGRPLLDDVSFRVGDGAHVALVGANGAGKTTLLKLVSGDLQPTAGVVTHGGRLGVMRQFIGSINDDSTVRDLLLSIGDPALHSAGKELDAAELAMMERDDEKTSMRYAHALAAWGDAGGYTAEVLWDTCTISAFGEPFDRVGHRPVRTLSGGEQKRLALEALIRSDAAVLLLDEPDNYLDVEGKRWLERTLNECPKTVLYVSHDRELLANTATRVVTVEAHSAWVHGGGFASYHDARAARIERLDELHRRWEEEHQRLKDLVNTLRVQAKISPDMASRYRAMVTRLEKFEAAGPPPERPTEQKVSMRLGGGRTGVRALVVEDLELHGLTKPWSTEVFFGERVGILGPNGTGKSHFLRLLAGDGSVAHSGQARLGARVVPGYFAQTHDDPALQDRTLVEVLHAESHDRGKAMARLKRYELDGAGDQRFRNLSGGQQARFQILLLEVRGATMLLLDEPTDNLDIASAEALEDGLAAYEGTVLAVTHDRWFMRSFDRFLVFGDDGVVSEALEPF
ncbi:MAG TPA: ABC-F family ATP-binding cassette domain-containing protein [Frankiaceae bacterium]|nr:ABC-F family ATP-binding cassette domain-containing protein [Frankiaceae bacterium]